MITSAELSGPCLGCMFFGTEIDEERSFDLLDRFRAAGGRLLDTANNYAFWVDGATGDESELLLGRWLSSRGARDDVLIASKIGARPQPDGTGYRGRSGLSAPAVREQVTGSLRRLGVDRLDLLYAHIDDRQTPLAETVAAFGALVDEGLVRAVACSNLTLPRLQEPHAVSDHTSVARYVATQMRFTYLTARPDADFKVQELLTDDLADYAAEQGMTVFAYSTLLAGAYGRDDRPLPDEYRHA